MKFLTFFTDSHKELYDNYFYPSYTKHFPKNDLIIEHHPTQYCESGSYTKNGWWQTQKNKVNFVINQSLKFKDEIIVFCDADIVLFKDFRDDLTNKLKEYEFLCQKAYIPSTLTMRENYRYITPYMCSGFYCFISNTNNINFLKTVKNSIYKDDQCDQYHFNINKDLINYSLLDDTYPNTGLFSNSRVIDDKFDVSLEDLKKCNLFHCNWTKDYIDKKNLMDKIFKKYYK